MPISSLISSTELGETYTFWYLAQSLDISVRKVLRSLPSRVIIRHSVKDEDAEMSFCG